MPEDLKRNSDSSITGLNQPIKALDQLNVLGEKISKIMGTFAQIKGAIANQPQQNQSQYSKIENKVDKAVAKVEAPKEIIKEVVKKGKLKIDVEAGLKELKNIENKEAKIKDLIKDLEILHKNNILASACEEFLNKFVSIEYG